MAQERMAEGQIEIKSSAVKFFDVWIHKLQINYKDWCPDKLSKVELQGGTRHVAGSIIIWNYVAYGKCEAGRTKTEKIDEQNLSVTYKNIDGNISRLYKSFKSRIQFIPKGEGCIVKWTIDYEKMNDDTPKQIFTWTLRLALGCIKDTDARLCSA